MIPSECKLFSGDLPLLILSTSKFPEKPTGSKCFLGHVECIFHDPDENLSLEVQWKENEKFSKIFSLSMFFWTRRVSVLKTPPETFTFSLRPFANAVLFLPLE